jgi:uncharacterized protein (TIRG00374 family)
MQREDQQQGHNGQQNESEDDKDVALQPTVVMKRVKKALLGKDDQSRIPTDRLADPSVPQLPEAPREHRLLDSHSNKHNRNFFDGDGDKGMEEMEEEEEIPRDASASIPLSTAHIMQLSGMRRVVRPGKSTRKLSEEENKEEVEEWWPEGIKQTGPLPVVNLYGKEPFGRTQAKIPVVGTMPQAEAKPEPKWKMLLNTPAAKVTIGLLVGIGLLFLVAKVVDIPSTMTILREKLTTPIGIMLALLSGVAFLLAFCIRGIRWKLFLNPLGQVSVIKAIQLFLVGIFLNFLLPIRGGEVAKSLMLKRIAGIPISQSLPTVAMDKALDLMPALFIMAIVPLLGVAMDIKLWLVLGLVGSLLIGLIFFLALAAWKRNAAIALLQRMTGILPKSFAQKIEGFATGFVDSLLAGASQPKIFIPAVLLTIVAVIFDGLFAMLAFWTVGEPISFGTAIFGYTVYNMFYILPTPPGQVGSNEAIGLLVFYGLLHLNAHHVTAMFLFSHPWAALLMCVSGMTCLSSLGLTISSAMKVQSGDAVEGEQQIEVQKKQIVETSA